MKLSPQVHPSRSPFSVSYGCGEVMLLQDTLASTSRSMYGDGTVASSSRSICFTSADDVADSHKLSPKVFGVGSARSRVGQSLEELAIAPPPPPVWGSLQDLPSISNVSEEKDTKDVDKEEGVQAWAASFERLLDDPCGLDTFTAFLQKEFSQENMMFWLACSKYGKTESAEERRRLARQMFELHLAEGALEPVNVDAHARQQAKAFLDSGDSEDDAPLDLFLPAQKQVFNLMKFDSYPRFIKSDLYQELCRGPPLARKCRNQPEDGRRKSLLPWSRKMRSKSKDRHYSDHTPDDAVSLSSRSSVTSWGRSSRHSSISNQGSEMGLVRFIFTDGATAVLQIQEGETVRDLVERVTARRGISYNAYEIYMAGESRARALDGPAAELTNHEVRLEQRILFRLDLPNRKTISVKAKVNKTLKDVLRPVLHKYNYQIDTVTICSMSENEVVELSVPITSVDGRRLTVLTRSGEPATPLPAAIVPPSRTFIRPHASLDEITNKVFEELLASKSSGSSGGGSVKSEASSATLPMPMPRFLRMRRKGLNNVGKGEKSDTDDLYEDLKRAQRSRLEDQRGTEINYELPDFLKDKENAPQGLCKMRKIREESGGGLSDSRPASDPTSERRNPATPHQAVEAKALTCKTYETPHSTPVPEATPSPLRKEPPPLPPKPKLFRASPDTVLRNHNFLKPSDVKTFARISRSRRAAYLDQPSSSFV